MKKHRPLGKFSPYLFQVEPVGGCNLKCYHCPAATQDKSARERFIDNETWANAMRVVKGVMPQTRVEIAMSGEPTLHPEILNLIWMARKITPQSQFNMITNGTQLISGRLTYCELFKAGMNVIYVDMYAPREKHIELAEASGYKYVELVQSPATMPEGSPSPWTYYGPDTKFIALALPPEHWPDSARTRHRLGTWMGNLDWDRASKHGLTKLKEPMKRRCNQPFKHVATKFDGEYVLCCVDFLGETKGMYGNVNDGIAGFKEFWFGAAMQGCRSSLRAGDRAAIKQCAKCDIVFGRADIVWPESAMDKVWDGKAWQDRKPKVGL